MAVVPEKSQAPQNPAGFETNHDQDADADSNNRASGQGLRHAKGPYNIRNRPSGSGIPLPQRPNHLRPLGSDQRGHFRARGLD